MDLGPSERVIVAERLLASVEETEEHREAWNNEIARRLEDYRAGRIMSYSAREVRERIDNLLKK